MVDALLQSEEYSQKRAQILSRQPPPVNVPPTQSSIVEESQTALALPINPKTRFTSSEILKEVVDFKSKRIANSNAKFKRPRVKSQNSEYLALGRKMFEKVNEKLTESLGKRSEMVQETINEINSKRFENQEKWLERYLELKEEIKGHRVRIIALKKALQK